MLRRIGATMLFFLLLSAAYGAVLLLWAWESGILT